MKMYILGSSFRLYEGFGGNNIMFELRAAIYRGREKGQVKNMIKQECLTFKYWRRGLVVG